MGTGRRRRVVPNLGFPLERPRATEERLRHYMREAGTPFRPYDMRRAYIHWMEEAGIPRTRRKLYAGHGAKDTTDLYERHEVTAFLLEDAKRLTRYLKRSTGYLKLEA